ncbi:hypothetical protein SALBM217S_09028 [Streptomyces griseoloalbus]
MSALNALGTASAKSTRMLPVVVPSTVMTTTLRS